MSDLFHEDIPLDYIQRVFTFVRAENQHQFQVLTKRAERLAELANALNFRRNIWMDASVENATYAERIDFASGSGAYSISERRVVVCTD